MTEAKVISIGDAKKEQESNNIVPIKEPEKSETDFSKVMAENAAKQERLKKERAKSNASVTKSYRLKK